MTSRLENEINDYRDKIEKYLSSPSSSSSESNYIEEVKDILNVLIKITITIEVLRNTRIGTTIQDIKKRFNGNEIGTLSKQLLNKWKKDCEVKKPPRPVDFSNSKSKEVNKMTIETAAAVVVNHEDDEFNDDSHYNMLSTIRKNVLTLIVDSFKLNTNESIAKFLAFNVEDSIHKIHSADSDQKSYLNKAKTLTYNLKKNEKLRLDVIEGNIQADCLAYMSTNDLASDDLRRLRNEAAKNAMLARRGDLYEITRAEILQANGIDPNKGGEFTCRKCKGTKTTHYAMQTRSSDEPMTVFVGCLTCGNRWRCT